MRRVAANALSYMRAAEGTRGLVLSKGTSDSSFTRQTADGEGLPPENARRRAAPGLGSGDGTYLPGIVAR